jgi:hypothetical protein
MTMRGHYVRARLGGIIKAARTLNRRQARQGHEAIK